MSNNEYINEHFPLLSAIDSPADLRKLDVAMLPKVCEELRRFMVHFLSSNPGHFASSMGAVEINVALHYVFDTPNDRLVWDVGHQAYAHKILTGRRDRFCENRTMGGLSGFPNPSESPYDTFMAGHASNSISAALGMSIASELKGEQRKIVAVIGDASISGGLAFEGLNNVSAHPNNMLIVLNDNDMSIDENVGALSAYMTKLTTSKRYNNIRYKLYQFLRRRHIITDKGKGLVLRFNNAMKSLLSGQQNIFEGLNIRYFGPFDGHDVVQLVKTFRDVKDMTGPKIVHLHTRKGKGYKPAEENPAVWHAPGKFNEETGERIVGDTSGKPLKYQDVFGHTLVQLAKQNDRAVGISEGHAVTFSGGLAKDGMHPFCAIYSSFLQRGFDHIIHDVAIQHLPVTFCIDRAGLVGEDGVTHHGAYDLAYLSCIPGLTVSAPMDEHYLRHLMYTSQLEGKGPFAIRYPRGGGVNVDWECEMKELPVGKGRRLADGEQLAVLSIGTIGNEVQKALAMLKEKGIFVAHYDMIFLKPIDQAILEEVAAKYRHVITVEDGTVVGGLGSRVSQWMASRPQAPRITMLGIPDQFVHQGTVAQLKAQCGIDAASIFHSIESILSNL